MAEPALPLQDAFSSPRAIRALLAATILLSVFLAFWRLNNPLEGSEGRWAMVSREMVSSGDPFRMTVGGRPYDDKPFGSYWLIIVASKVTGGMSEFTLRLPGAISYLLTVLLVYAIGKRTAGERPAAVAAFIYATLFRILYFSREASADAQTTLGIAAALLLALEEGEDPRWWRWPLFGLVIGLSSLMKGLTGFAVPCFVVFLWCVFVRGFRWLRPIPLLLGVVAFAAAIATPFLIAHARQGDWEPVKLLLRESVGRAVSPFDHRQPWHYYFWNQFEFLSPWAVFLPWAIFLWVSRIRAQAATRGWSLSMFDRPEDRRNLFPFFCYAAIFLFFTISGSRRTYYLMPAAPFVSLILAQALLEDFTGWALKLKRAMLWVIGGAMTLAGVAAFAAGCLRLLLDAPPKLLSLGGQVTREIWHAMPPWLALAGAAAVFGVMILRRTRCGRPALAPQQSASLHAAGLAPLMCGMAFVVATMTGMYEGFRALDQSLPRFGRAVDSIVPPGECIEVAGLEDKETGGYTGIADVLYYIHREPASVAHRPTRWRIVFARSLPEVLKEGNYRERCRLIEGLTPKEEQFTKNATLLERAD